MLFALLYKPPCGEWYVHSHKLYDSREQAREKASKFLEPGVPIAIVEVGTQIDDMNVEYVR